VPSGPPTIAPTVAPVTGTPSSTIAAVIVINSPTACRSLSAATVSTTPPARAGSSVAATA
jgi:hypothetical protein